MPLLIPPAPVGSDPGSPEFAQFFEILRNKVNNPPFYAAPTDPSFVGVPNGTFAVWKNTTSGVIKLWANDGGALVSVTLT